LLYINEQAGVSPLFMHRKVTFLEALVKKQGISSSWSVGLL